MRIKCDEGICLKTSILSETYLQENNKGLNPLGKWVSISVNFFKYYILLSSTEWFILL